jgi:hypothetical protein
MKTRPKQPGKMFYLEHILLDLVGLSMYELPQIKPPQKREKIKERRGKKLPLLGAMHF